MLKPTHATCRGNDTHISTVDGGKWLGVGHKRLFVGVEERDTITGHHTEILHPFLRKATHTATATATETRAVRCTIPHRHDTSRRTVPNRDGVDMNNVPLPASLSSPSASSTSDVNTSVASKGSASSSSSSLAPWFVGCLRSSLSSSSDASGCACSLDTAMLVRLGSSRPSDVNDATLPPLPPGEPSLAPSMTKFTSAGAATGVPCPRCMSSLRAGSWSDWCEAGDPATSASPLSLPLPAPWPSGTSASKLWSPSPSP